jgi:hypothetical protein
MLCWYCQDCSTFGTDFAVRMSEVEFSYISVSICRMSFKKQEVYTCACVCVLKGRGLSCLDLSCGISLVIRSTQSRHKLYGKILLIFKLYCSFLGPDSAVVIVTHYRLDGPGIESLWGFSAPIQTGPGAHPASYTMGTGFLSGGGG